jgi:pimeloyl-ACP methyl ester carboxylesterase
LADIRVPTLVLVGRQDDRTPLPLAQEIAAGIPGARLTIIEESGHLPTMEQPEATNQALRSWLAG